MVVAPGAFLPPAGFETLARAVQVGLHTPCLGICPCMALGQCVAINLRSLCTPFLRPAKHPAVSPIRSLRCRGCTPRASLRTPWHLHLPPQISAPGLRLWVSVINYDYMGLITLYGGPDALSRGAEGFSVGVEGMGRGRGRAGVG